MTRVRINLNDRQIADVLNTPESDEFAYTRLTRKQRAKVIAANTVAAVEPVSWESVWGFAFGERASGIVDYFIPAEGLSIAVPIPMTSDKVAVGFSTIEFPPSMSVAGKIEYNVSRIAGDHTSLPIRLVGTRTDSITGGINIGGKDLELVPGSTPFWNLRFPSGIGHMIKLQYAFRTL